MKAGLPLVYGSFKLSQHILNCLLPNFAICLSLASFWISNACTVEGSSSCMLGQCRVLAGVDRGHATTGQTVGWFLWPHTSLEACPSGGTGHRPSIMASRSSPLLLPLAGCSPDSVNSPMILASSAFACWSYYTELSQSIISIYTSLVLLLVKPATCNVCIYWTMPVTGTKLMLGNQFSHVKLGQTGSQQLFLVG